MARQGRLTRVPFGGRGRPPLHGFVVDWFLPRTAWCTCVQAVSHWYTPGVHVRPGRAALVHTRCPRASRPRRIGTRPVSTCVQAAPHWYTPGVHVRPGRAALVHTKCPRASRPRRIGTHQVYPCAQVAPHWYTPGVP